MPEIFHIFSSYDNDLLSIIAGVWGIEISETAEIPLARQVAEGMLAAARSGDLTSTLPDTAREALQKLAAENGRLPVPSFSRLFGDIRPMGAGRRQRERPDQNPDSPAEMLWYAGLIGKAFLDTGQGPQEFFIIPDDILAFIPSVNAGRVQVFGRPAPPELALHIRPSNDHILDEAVTLLAAQRMGLDFEKIPGYKPNIPVEILKALLKACGLLDHNDIPIPETTRVFLESSNAEAMAFLVSNWRSSREFNELLLLPGLTFEGQIQNDPLATREKLLSFLSCTPQGGWVDISAFIDDIHKRQPDFQRPAGDYDSWFIRSAKDKTFLRGFSSWDKVEGSLLRFFFSGMLFWLGIVDLASGQRGNRSEAFRLSDRAEDLLADRTPREFPVRVKTLRVLSDGEIIIPRGCPRTVRYQVSRACEWISAGAGEYHYRMTPAFLDKAAGQGLKVNYLLGILKRHHQGPLPPNILQALERWERDGLQARLNTIEIITVESEEILRSLRKSPAGRHILETINSTSAIIRPGSKPRVMKALLEMGYLSADLGENKDRENDKIT